MNKDVHISVPQRVEFKFAVLVGIQGAQRPGTKVSVRLLSKQEQVPSDCCSAVHKFPYLLIYLLTVVGAGCKR